MKEIQLTQRKVALVDDEDFEGLNQWRWHFTNSGYAARRAWPSNKIVLMHREIMNTPTGKDTDHINRNGLDNRRTNLRVCTRSQNNLNKNKEKINTSGYKGVFWRNDQNLWLARVGTVYVGKFKDKTDAAKAYDNKAKELFGEFAKLNFPEHEFV